MLSLPPITLRLRGWKLIDRVALAFLLLCSIALGAGCGLLFVYAIEDQHFEEHWGIDFPRIASAAFRNLAKRRITGGASTISMQLAGNLFLDRSDRSFRRKMQEMLLALQIERRYTKPQIFTMYANQVYLAHGNYGFAAAAEFYFGKS